MMTGPAQSAPPATIWASPSRGMSERRFGQVPVDGGQIFEAELVSAMGAVAQTRFCTNSSCTFPANTQPEPPYTDRLTAVLKTIIPRYPLMGDRIVAIVAADGSYTTLLFRKISGSDPQVTLTRGRSVREPLLTNHF